jgi:hypothetical protein
MDLGQVEQRIVRECYLRKHALPDSIQNAPQLFLGLEIYWQAFADLSSCRAIGWGAGPIPYTAIVDYARAWGLDTEDTAFFMSEMDRVYMEKANAPKK